MLLLAACHRMSSTYAREIYSTVEVRFKVVDFERELVSLCSDDDTKTQFSLDT